MKQGENKHEKGYKKRKSRITDFHLLIISAVIFIIQYSSFSVNTINFPKWIYILLIIIAIIINLIIKRAIIKDIVKLTGFVNVFKPFIIIFSFSIGVGLLLFGIINKQYAKNEELEFEEMKIVRAFEGSSRSSDRIYFVFKCKELGLSLPSSPQTSRIIKDKNMQNRSYILLEYKRGLLGTYIVESKEIIFK